MKKCAHRVETHFKQVETIADVTSLVFDDALDWEAEKTVFNVD
ncbi:MAG: hypothetical protein AB9921_09690 [Erysipelotrichaceae bacterium]